MADPDPGAPPPEKPQQPSFGEKVHQAGGMEIASLAVGEAAGHFKDTLKLGLAILPRPGEGIEGFCKSRPLGAASILVGLSVLLFPLTVHSVFFPGPGGFRFFARGVLMLLVANAALWAFLYLGLRVVSRRPADAVGAFALLAVTQVPFIPLMVAGWALSWISALLAFLCMTAGLNLSILYLHVGLRRVHELAENPAIYWAVAGFIVWLGVFGLTARVVG